MARITVEDCLQQENNRFSLVLLSSKRTKQLLNGSRVLISDQRGNKAVVTSLREIAAGQVRFMTESEKMERERELAEQAERDMQAQQAAMKPATPLSDVGASLFHSDPPTAVVAETSNGHNDTNGHSEVNGHKNGAENDE